MARRTEHKLKLVTQDPKFPMVISPIELMMLLEESATLNQDGELFETVQESTPLVHEEVA